MDKIRTRPKGEIVIKNQKEHEDRMIENIIECFDFDRCQFVMRNTGWTWGFNGYFPTVDDLKRAARERIKNAIEIAKKEKHSNYPYYCSSGGLKATARVNRYGHIYSIELEFILTSWDSDGDY